MDVIKSANASHMLILCMRCELIKSYSYANLVKLSIFIQLFQQKYSILRLKGASIKISLCIWNISRCFGYLNNTTTFLKRCFAYLAGCTEFTSSFCSNLHLRKVFQTAQMYNIINRIYCWIFGLASKSFYNTNT